MATFFFCALKGTDGEQRASSTQHRKYVFINVQEYILPSLLRSILIYLSSFNLKIRDNSLESKKDLI